MFHDFCQSVTLVFCQRTHVSHDHHPRGSCCSRARISYDEPCMGAIFYQKIFASALITALFYEVDEQLGALPKHPEAHLWPSEVVTLQLLHALKGVGNRAFYRWLTRDYRALFPQLPERTRLFRLFTTHQDGTQAFLAAPTVLGVLDPC